MILLQKKYGVKEKYITHLNAEMNGRHEIETEDIAKILLIDIIST